MSFCKYKDMFGKPNEGIHKDRIFGLALWDVVGMIILILVIYSTTSMGIGMISVIVLLLTIALHKLFCVDTALNVMIFGKSDVPTK